MGEAFDLTVAIGSFAAASRSDSLQALMDPIHHTSLVLAVHGFSDLALELWEIGRDERMPGRQGTVWGDAAHRVHGIVTRRGERTRLPTVRQRDERRALPLDDRDWAEDHTDYTIGHLLRSGWTADQVAAWGAVEPDSLKADVLRFHRALDLYFEAADNGAILDRALDMLEELATSSFLPVYKRNELRLVAALHHLVRDDVDRADALLRSWRASLQTACTNDLEYALGIAPIAERFVAGVLQDRADKEQVTTAMRAAMAHLRRRLDEGEEANPACEWFDFEPSYGTILLEPRVPDPDVALIPEEEDHDRGYMVLGAHMAIFVPDLDELLRVSVTLTDEHLGPGGRSFAFEVIDDLYLRSVDTPDDSCRFGIATGVYRVSFDLQVDDGMPPTLRIALRALR